MKLLYVRTVSCSWIDWKSSSQNLFSFFLFFFFLLTLRQSPLCSCTLFDGADITDAFLQWWVGVVGRGTYHSPPLHTNTDEPFDLTLSLFKRDPPLNHSHNPPENTHFNTRPSSLLSLWNHITCVLFFSWGVYRSRWDRMEDVEEEWSEEITTVRDQYGLSTGIPSQIGGSVPLPTVFRFSHVSQRRFKCLMW